MPEIDVDELAARLDAGAVLLDVRQPDEYESGHVPTARLVPLDTVPDHLEAITRVAACGPSRIARRTPPVR